MPKKHRGEVKQSKHVSHVERAQVKQAPAGRSPMKAPAHAGRIVVKQSHLK